jgi:hypothetical protein
MFVQFIRGQTRDRAAVQAQFDRWVQELKPGAVGFVGSTSGITADGMVVSLCRFESAAAAAKNGARPEEGEWWRDFVADLDGEPEVKDTDDAEVLFDRGCDDARFVQIMLGSGDPETLRDLDRRSQEVGADLRPDLLGGYRAFFADGSFADVAYFTSEADARAAESQPVPDNIKALFDERTAAVGEMTYIDIAEPRII